MVGVPFGGFKQIGKKMTQNPTFSGELSSLRKWWDYLCELGPSFGYFVNATKT